MLAFQFFYLRRAKVRDIHKIMLPVIVIGPHLW